MLQSMSAFPDRGDPDREQTDRQQAAETGKNGFSKTDYIKKTYYA